jgi:hypothetical protein
MQCSVHGVNDMKQTKHTDQQPVPDPNVLEVHKNLEEINHQVGDNKLLHFSWLYNYQRWLRSQRNQQKTFNWKNGNDKTRKNYEGSGHQESYQN